MRTLNEVLAPAIEWYQSERAAFLEHGGCPGMRNRRGWWSNGRLTEEAVDFGLFLE